MLRYLRKFHPFALLLNIYKTYLRSKLDYGLSNWGCNTEVNLNRVQRIQNLLARIICNDFDYIQSCGIDLVRSRPYEKDGTTLCVFWCSNVFIASHPISWVIYMCMIQREPRIWIYINHGAPRRFIWRFFCIRVVHYGISCPRGSKNLIRSFNDFKHNYRLLNDSIHPEFKVLFICTPILYPILMLLFYPLCLHLVRSIHIRNLSQTYHDIFAFMYDLYLWMCIYVFFIDIFLFCNRVPWKNSVTVWLNGLTCMNIFERKNI